MGTYAATKTVMATCAATGHKLQMRMIKRPQVGNDGSPVPNTGDDYLLAIKDCRGGSQGNAAVFRTLATAYGDNREPNGSAEPEHVIRGLNRGCVGPGHTGWLLYDASATQFGGDLPQPPAGFLT